MISDSRTKTGATATAILTIEISSLGSWGEDCCIDQVYSQAARAAVGRLSAMAQKYGPSANIRMIGEPEVTVVMATRKV